jgi:two-component system, NarL family, response regulator NreC
MLIKLIIAEDNEIFRNGVIELLQQKWDDLLIPGSASNGQEVLELVRLHRPHIILMDIEMPVMNGIDATKNILEHFPNTKIIGWSMSREKWVIQDMIEAGARGYLLKDTRLEEVILAIKKIMGGENYYCQEVCCYITA